MDTGSEHSTNGSEGTLLGAGTNDPGQPEGAGAGAGEQPQQTGQAGQAGQAGQEPQGSTAAKEYEAFTIPEDAPNVIADEGAMKEFGALAQKHGLAQEAAQEFVNLGAKMIQRAAGDRDEAMHAKLEEIKYKWHRETTGDPAIAAELNHARRVVNRFGGDDLKAMFDETGVGSHRLMVKFLIEVGKAMGEAPLQMPNAGPTGPADARAIANQLYDGKM